MTTNVHALNHGYRQRSEAEILADLRNGSASLLALIERWPQDGMLHGLTAASNTTCGIDRLLRELRLAVSNPPEAA